jgi:uncharacterized phage-like protein YoqJ
MKEKITVIKDTISFSELPKKIQDTFILDQAKAMLISFDEGVYTMQTALLDAKKHYEEWSDYKYVLYNSSIHGECADEIGKEGWR